MTLRTVLACSALALGVGLSSLPAAYAADGDAMAKPGDAMMHKTGMKTHKTKKSMMHGDTMMKKQDTPPAQ